MSESVPWLEPGVWAQTSRHADVRQVEQALVAQDPGVRQFACLLSEAAGTRLEEMARRAQALTRRHFGRTINLYAPLYLSNYCPGGCVYCGFASDREQPRHKLAPSDLVSELRSLKRMGFEEVLLLTGEQCPEADFSYLRDCVAEAARHIHQVTVESFAMTEEEYGVLSDAGCTGVTLYQETYDRALYGRVHRWGCKRDYDFRLEAPARAFGAGMRTVGVGALLGLGDPLYDALAVFQHVCRLRKTAWRGGVSVSFPRLRPETGGFRAGRPVSERMLARMIFAFRICLPDVPLVLSTRESAAFRDGMAGVGISRMSVASRTTVGGYAGSAEDDGQFEVSDTRDVATFCAMLRAKGLEPVFKNWDAVYR